MGEILFDQAHPRGVNELSVLLERILSINERVLYNSAVVVRPNRNGASGSHKLVPIMQAEMNNR